jgi:flagellar biosynthesis chaperone FliJ
LTNALEAVNQNIKSAISSANGLKRDFADELHIGDSSSQYADLQKIMKQIDELTVRQLDIQISLYNAMIYQAENIKNQIIEQYGVDTLVAFSNTFTQDMFENKQIYINKYDTVIRHYREMIEILTKMRNTSAN